MHGPRSGERGYMIAEIHFCPGRGNGDMPTWHCKLNYGASWYSRRPYRGGARYLLSHGFRFASPVATFRGPIRGQE